MWKNSKKSFRLSLLASFAAILLWYGQGYCETNEEIYAWTVQQSKVTGTYEMPDIRFVDKEELKAAFKKGSENSYLRWEDEYGTDEAKKIMKEYLEGIVGLFDEKTRIIYVGNFMNQCRQQAVLAHELTHYLQNVTQGRIDPDSYGADNLYMMREWQAYTIEDRFTAAFCPEEAEDGVVKASSK